MKFYFSTLLIILLSLQLSFSQNSTLDQTKSELAKLKTESLQIEPGVEIYPNPADDFVNITFSNSQLKNVQIEVYNVIGNKLEFDSEQVNASSYKVNVKEFHSGYYLIIIKDPVARFNKAFKFRKM